MLTFQRAHQQMLDQAWTERTGLPLLLLMEQAAQAITRACLDLIPVTQRTNTHILVLAGKGQNGGDAFACARQLVAEGFPVDCLEAFPAAELPPEAAQNRQAWLAFGGPLLTLSADLDRLAGLRCPDLVVDGLFGTGFRAERPLPPAICELTSQVKLWRQSGAQVVAIDIPSGVDADTGHMAEGAVEADMTVTFVRPKTGICATPGRFAAGRVIVDRIGIPDQFVTDLFKDMLLPIWIEPDMIRELRTVRHPNSHKGTFGRVLILGGSPGLPGAASLATEAASRSGAGLVYLGTGESVAAQTLAAVSEALLTALPENDPDRLIALLDQLIQGKQVVAIGPGAGQAPWLDHALQRALTQSSAVVIDADGLNAIAAQPDQYFPLLKARRSAGLAPAVLTPHPGEFTRLAADLDWHNRQHAAQTLSQRLDAIVLLKGASTVIAAPDGRLWINPTGNAGLAKGGSGDVLCGLIAGLLAQNLPAFEAAASGAYLHGLAADLAADLESGGTGRRALLPNDVLRAIGRAFAAAGWGD